MHVHHCHVERRASLSFCTASSADRKFYDFRLRQSLANFATLPIFLLSSRSPPQLPSSIPLFLSFFFNFLSNSRDFFIETLVGFISRFLDTLIPNFIRILEWTQLFRSLEFSGKMNLLVVIRSWDKSCVKACARFHGWTILDLIFCFHVVITIELVINKNLIRENFEIFSMEFKYFFLVAIYSTVD